MQEKSQTKESMRYYDVSLIMIAIILGAVVLGMVSSNYLDDDNAFEEISEEIIEEQTGFDIDLSPKSKERSE